MSGIRESLPELPEMKRRRYDEMGRSMQDVLFLANDVNVCRSNPIILDVPRRMGWVTCQEGFWVEKGHF